MCLYRLLGWLAAAQFELPGIRPAPSVGGEGFEIIYLSCALASQPQVKVRARENSPASFLGSFSAPISQQEVYICTE